MPPCAAMECARRGESWKQKHLTLYPSSPSVAAADPPASPDPTTMISYFRLFAGFTSFISKRHLSQAFSIGPLGILASSIVRVAVALAPAPGVSPHEPLPHQFLWRELQLRASAEA